jgi:hypothetical protein
MGRVNPDIRTIFPCFVCFFYPEDEGTRFFPNIRNDLPTYTGSHPSHSQQNANKSGHLTHTAPALTCVSIVLLKDRQLRLNWEVTNIELTSSVSWALNRPQVSLNQRFPNLWEQGQHRKRKERATVFRTSHHYCPYTHYRHRADTVTAKTTVVLTNSME